MCKIILKYDNITAKEVNEHRETCEEGAGFVWYKEDRLFASRAMRHQSAYAGYVSNAIHSERGHSPFTLFHSRWRSSGEVKRENIQPFKSEDIAFCHNGTVGREKLFYACLSMGLSFDGEESDSFLIFKILQKLDLKTSVAFLKMLEQNFVLVDRRTKTIHIIGNYELEANKAISWIHSARNKYVGDELYIVTNFAGKVLHKKIKKEEPRHYYLGANNPRWHEAPSSNNYVLEKPEEIRSQPLLLEVKNFTEVGTQEIKGELTK